MYGKPLDNKDSDSVEDIKMKSVTFLDMMGAALALVLTALGVILGLSGVVRYVDLVDAVFRVLLGSSMVGLSWFLLKDLARSRTQNKSPNPP